MGGRGSGGRRCHLPPPPASWPAAAAASQATASRRSQGDEVASRVPSWSGFDEDFEVHLPGRGGTTFFVRVAGRGLAATNGVAVVFHGVSKRRLHICDVTTLIKHVEDRRRA